jgi:hypothetical protein
MSDEQIRRIVNDSYDDSNEEGLLVMLRDFYSRKLMSTAIYVWVSGAAFVALSVYSAIQFFRTGQVQGQIMYASLFLVGAGGLGLTKIFAWGMVHQHAVRRDLKHMELRLAELTEMLKSR